MPLLTHFTKVMSLTEDKGGNFYSRGFPTFKRAWNLGRQVIREFLEDNCTREAHAMAYRTLLCSVPMLAVFLGVFSALGLFENFREKLVSTLYTYLVPSAGDMAKQYLIKFADNTKTLGVLGLVGTLAVALYLFYSIDHSFNRIWGVDEKRRFMRKFASFTAILLWAPILIGLSFYFSGKLHAYLSLLQGEITMPGWLSLNILPVFLSLLGLTIIYVLVPNTRVSLKYALIGAGVAAVLWELVKWVFNYYATNAVRYDKVYGSLAVIPLLIISLYLLWAVVFVGAEITYVLQNYRYNEVWGPRECNKLRPYLAVGAILELGGRFYRGETLCGLDEIAAKYKVAIPMMRSLFNELADAGVLVRFDQDVFFPAKSLRLISLMDVIAATMGSVSAVKSMNADFPEVAKGLPSGAIDAIGKALSETARAQERILKSVILEDLVSVTSSEDRARFTEIAPA